MVKRGLLFLGLLATVFVGGLVARQSLPDIEVVPNEVQAPVTSRAASEPDLKRAARERQARHQGQELRESITDEQREKPPGDRPGVPDPFLVAQ